MTLLDTKLFAPRVRKGLVPRPRLDDRLRGTNATRLAGVRAGGFGNTTVAGRLARSRRRPAWVSLDTVDSQSTAFWSYVLTALERAAPGTGAVVVGAPLLFTAGVLTISRPCRSRPGSSRSASTC